MDRRLVALTVLLLSAPRFTIAADLPPGAMLRLGDTRFRAGGPVERLEFAPDAKTVTATVRADGRTERVVVWDAASGTPVGVRQLQPVGAVIRWQPSTILDTTRGVVITPGGTAVVRDFETRKDLARLGGHFARVTAVSVSPDGRRIATGSADGLVRVWDADTCRPLTEPRGHTAPVYAVEVSPDGRTALTSGADRSARVWDLVSGRELRAFPTSGEFPATFTADGSAVRIPMSGRVVVRDLVTGLEVVPRDRPKPELFPLGEWLLRLNGVCVAVSPDGRTVAIGSRSGEVQLYEAATGQLRRRLAGHAGACLAMTFTPDGSRLVTGGADHAALVWAVRLQDVPLSAELKRETRAAALWDRMARGDGEAAYAAAARLAADPGTAVKIARLRLKPTAVTTPVAAARAVELLEAIGTQEARSLLRELAAGDPAERRTREAAAALNRLSGPKYNPAGTRNTPGSKP